MKGHEDVRKVGMTWTVPNILTILRLLAAPCLAVMFLYFKRPLADWFALILFLGAAVTDFLDGYLARAWKQESRLGAMLDPIADKAMVVIALMIVTGFSGMNPWFLLPATAIVLREIFVSGLREFLGGASKPLKVTMSARWKTTVQMTAIATLFATGIFQHNIIERTQGMDGAIIAGIMAGDIPDGAGLRWNAAALEIGWWSGVILLWVAAGLTLLTGWDYLRKTMPYLKDGA